MVELTPKERLQPALLDRLTDDEPHKKQENRTQRVLSMAKLRQAVLRDMAWLFNTVNLAAVQDLDEYPYAKHSVINFGLPEMTGQTVSGADVTELEASLRQAILDFEPRILSQTLRINVVMASGEMSHNALSFDIEGQLWAQPAPEHLLLRTQLDLENGDVQVTERF